MRFIYIKGIFLYLSMCISINTYSITNLLSSQHSDKLILPLQPKPLPSHKEKTETMAARKIKILFQNNTQQTLNWVDSGVEHGERRSTLAIPENERWSLMGS